MLFFAELCVYVHACVRLCVPTSPVNYRGGVASLVWQLYTRHGVCVRACVHVLASVVSLVVLCLLKRLGGSPASAMLWTA